MEDMLLEPVTYYKNQKGKNIRKSLCEIFGKLLAVNNEDIDLINRITNDVHNASLVIDDIEDNSLLRRNEPCAHIKYGIPLSLNAGYYSFFKSLVEISNNFSKETTHKIIEYIYLIHEGQGMDIYYTQNKMIPDLNEYEKMMIYKTGYAFIMNLELLIDKSTNVIMKKNHEKLKNVLMGLSLFFQIRDDYINLTDPDYWKSKGFCQDFDEEKISYLIVYFTQLLIKKAQSESKQETMYTANIMDMMKDKSNESKKKILLLFHEHGLFDIIYDKLMELKQAVLSEMNFDVIFNQLPVKKFNVDDIYIL
jgi:geranylgeranyl diphosphate synthase type 3